MRPFVLLSSIVRQVSTIQLTLSWNYFVLLWLGRAAQEQITKPVIPQKTAQNNDVGDLYLRLLTRVSCTGALY
uniref:Putative secreted protein n=1 Tax=Rhipicephalus microplus TaxID=6941 RepID=A0A6M2DAZ1_RHIMP